MFARMLRGAISAATARIRPNRPVLAVVTMLVPGRPVMADCPPKAMMLPFLSFAALFLRYRLTAESLRPGLTWTLLLWIAFASMVAVGLYQFGQQLALWG